MVIYRRCGTCSDFLQWWDNLGILTINNWSLWNLYAAGFMNTFIIPQTLLINNLSLIESRYPSYGLLYAPIVCHYLLIQSIPITRKLFPPGNKAVFLWPHTCRCDLQTMWDLLWLFTVMWSNISTIFAANHSLDIPQSTTAKAFQHYRYHVTFL